MDLTTGCNYRIPVELTTAFDSSWQIHPTYILLYLKRRILNSGVQFLYWIKQRINELLTTHLVKDISTAHGYGHYWNNCVGWLQITNKNQRVRLVAGQEQ